MTELIKRIIPIFLIILSGYFIRKKKLINEDGFNTLKTLIMNVFLPASLFFAFIDADLSAGYLLIPVIVFILCGFLYFSGFILKKIKFLNSVYSAEFFTGYEFGMVGLALFSGVFGSESLAVISLIGLGHEFFIWFVYFPLLNSHSEENKRSFTLTLKSFISSPIIISIISAIIINKAGVSEFIFSNFITGGIIGGLKWLSSVTVSVVLIVLGASIHFEKIEMLKSLKFIITRAVFTLTAALLVFNLLSDVFKQLPVLFGYAWFTFFVLPPPYIIPIYVPDSHKDENVFMSNTIMLYTILSLAVFVVVLFMRPPV